MIDEIRSWLRTCPLIDQNDRFSVNYLAAEPMAFSIEETPNSPVLRRYLDGSTVRAKAWVLAAVQDYSPDTLAQIANSGFWEDFTGWVERQNRARNFPAMPEGCTAQRIEVTTTHYLYLAQANTARYQVQMQLTYFQRGAKE